MKHRFSVPNCKIPALVLISAFFLGTFILSALLSIRIGSGEITRIHGYQKQLLENGWVCQDRNGNTDVSALPFIADGREAVFTYTLPDDLHAGSVLAFPNYYQHVEVTVGDLVVFSYGMNLADRRFMPARLQCIIPLLPEYSNQQLTFHTISFYKAKNVLLPPVYLTTSGGVLGSILMENSFTLLFCIIFIVLGIILLVFSMVLYLNKTFSENLPLFHFAVLTLLASVWLFTDSDLKQLLFQNSQLCIVLSFECFMAMPFVFLLLLNSVSSLNSRTLKLLCGIHAVNILLQNLLYLVGILNFIQMNPMTHVLILLTAGAVITYMIRKTLSTNSFYARWILIAASISMLFSVLALAVFYHSGGMQEGQMFSWGFTVLMVIMLYLSIRKFQELSLASAKTQFYRKLAYTDVLTGLGSRISYEKRMTFYSDQFTLDSCVSIVLMDINGLKCSNDLLGHDAGDRLIQDAALCFQEAFAEYGELFRIGGDEFVGIFWNTSLNIPKMNKILRNIVNECNEDRETPLSMSCGYAVKTSRDHSIVSLEQLVHMADEEMYREKNKFYQNK